MSTTPANWYPDPTGRHQHRYWDGNAWSAHVSDNGITANDPLQPTGFDKLEKVVTLGGEDNPDKIRDQLAVAGTARGVPSGDAAFVGGGTIFTEPILVVNQKAKLIELTNQYGVFDREGRQIAHVNQVGQSAAKKVLRLVSSLDQYMTHRLEITDTSERVLLRLTRPAKVFKSTIIVSDPNDVEIGRIVQDNVFGKIHFTLQAGGATLGSINAENWRAWNFRVDDHNGTEIARLTKTFEGITRMVFTTADNYVVHIHTQIPQPLNSLVVAAALSVDTALKQDQRGLV